MRFSYLEIFIEHSAAAADIRYEAASYYNDGSQDTHWYDAEEGLSFYFDEAYDEIRISHIRIPEAHHLFNFGILAKTQFVRNAPFQLKSYIAVDTYVRERLVKAGIPMTLNEARQYDDENQ